jgi:CBS-domain-containing membrane protein
LKYKKWIYTFVGSFMGISLVFGMHRGLAALSHLDLVMLIGSFGASAVIIFSTPHSPYALPRHAIGGHLVSAVVGVLIYRFLGVHASMWFCAALAVSTAIFLMQVTRTIHPPGGATALIAVVGTEKVHALGYYYILSPVLTGILILLGTSALLRFVARCYRLMI